MTPDPTSPEGLAALEALARAATPGPWVAEEGEYECDGLCSHVGCPGHGNGDFRIYPVQDQGGDGAEFTGQNAAFIAAAREAVPALIARIKEMEAQQTKVTYGERTPFAFDEDAP